MPAEPIVKMFDINIDLYRTTKDIGFNSHGCRNLAMKKTDTEWNLLMDIDWTPDIKSIKEIYNFVKYNNTDKLKVYNLKNFFGSKSVTNERRFTNVAFLIHKDTFWKATGYDEELINMHTGDDLFYESLIDSGAIMTSTSWKVKALRNGRKVIYSSNTDITTYDDKELLVYQPRSYTDIQNIRQKVSERNKSKGHKDTITFSWEKII